MRGVFRRDLEGFLIAHIDKVSGSREDRLVPTRYRVEIGPEVENRLFGTPLDTDYRNQRAKAESLLAKSAFQHIQDLGESYVTISDLVTVRIEVRAILESVRVTSDFPKQKAVIGPLSREGEWRRERKSEKHLPTEIEPQVSEQDDDSMMTLIEPDPENDTVDDENQGIT
jgi:hypothetical protein